jgi:L-lactate utilization protein LutB
MNTAREQMLQRIREAVREGNRAGGSPAQIPERGQTGYQGAGADPLVGFGAAFTAAGGQLHVVADVAAAVAAIVDLVRSRSIRRVILGHGEVLDALPVVEPLRAAGIEVVDLSGGRQPPESRDSQSRDSQGANAPRSASSLKDSQGANAPRSASSLKEWFAAELGLSGVDYLIAETGSVVLASRPEQPRSLSLLPPVHIAVAQRRQLLPDLFDLFAVLGARGEDLPAGLTIITGPSKTGDIELRLVTGVHGPGEVHVVVIDSDG